jgi:hypothetical protein
MAYLKPAESLLWFAYWGHADAEGFAHPSPGTLAEELGHKKENHVRAMTKRLIEFGLLRKVDGAGGEVQLILPGKPPIQSRLGTNLVPIRDQFSPDSGPIQSRLGTKHNKEEQNNEQNNEQKAEVEVPDGSNQSSSQPVTATAVHEKW